MKKKRITVTRNISIWTDQAAFLNAHKDAINLSENVRLMIDKMIRKWRKEHGE